MGKKGLRRPPADRPRARPGGSSGAALIVAIIALLFMAGVGLALIYWMSSSSRQTARQQVTTQLSGVLDAATDRAMRRVRQEMKETRPDGLQVDGHVWGRSGTNGQLLMDETWTYNLKDSYGDDVKVEVRMVDEY